MKRSYEFSNKRFADWLSKKGLLYKRFCILASLLGSFFEETVTDKETAQNIAEAFSLVLSECDRISFNNYGQVFAYAVLHFLDRYHRFQIVFHEIAKLNLLPPVRERSINILDIGTGPATVLFAASDIYNLIQEYGKEFNKPGISQTSYITDYVERSEYFRVWLHYFTEYVNSHNREYQWKVPYHHGTFKDFTGINFDVQRSSWEHDGFHTKRFRYSPDLVVCSNFLTTEELLNKFLEEIRESIRVLRNRGLFIVVGASSEKEKYKNIYRQLKNYIEDYDYSNCQYIAHCKEVDIPQHNLVYSPKDVFGQEIKLFFCRILNLLETNNATQYIEGKTYKKFVAASKDDYDVEKTWEMHIYQKISKYRW